jgi:WD40 repeat protein
LIGNSPTTSADRIVISPDATQLWISKDSTLWICNIVDGSILNTITLQTPSLGSVEQYGGMELHPSNGYLYVASGQAIYKCLASLVTLVATNIVLTKIANKPAISSYITDITFSNDGEMIIADYVDSNTSKIFRVNYTDPVINYDLLAENDGLIDAMGSGTGI